MSSSDSTGNKVQLIADAGDPTTELSIIDGHFNRVAKGLGRTETALAPGIYKVKFKAGSLIREVHVTLEPGKSPVSVNAPDMPFSTGIPMKKTRTTHEYHEYYAHQLSTHIHREIGTGSQLFVFVRDLERQGEDDPATGLSLHDLAGNLLVDFTNDGERDSSSPDLDHWAGCTIALNPGSYRLRVQAGSRGILEQILVASPGWQTQVFLLRRPYGNKDRVRRADLTNASILLARIGAGFHPQRSDFRQAELARQGLFNGRAVVSADSLGDMLWAKSENPMLGIYGAHLHLLSPQPDLHLLQTVISKLYALVGDHPDVTALNVLLGEKAITRIDSLSYPVPPPLRSSWRILVEASIAHPGIIPAASFAARIADRIWGQSGWLIWQKPTEADLSQQVSSPIDLAVLSQMLPQITDRLTKTTSSESLAKVAAVSRLNNLEKDVLDYIWTVSRYRGSLLSSPAVSAAGEEVSLTSTALVQAFGVPYATLSEAVAGLIKKMNLSVS